MNCDAFRDSGGDRFALEACERAYRELNICGNHGGGAQVDLRNLVCVDRASVLDGHENVETAVGCSFDLQVRIIETRVAQAEAKGEERFDLFFVEPAIAH